METVWVGTTIGQRLEHVLKAGSWRQVDLADRVGVGQTAISNIVSDSSPKPNALTALAICETLGISMAWLLRGEGEPHDATMVSGKESVEIQRMIAKMPKAQKMEVLNFCRSISG